MRANTLPGQRSQPGEGDAKDGYPERHDGGLEPRHPVRQVDVIEVGPFLKQAVRGERTRPPPRRRPLQSHVERAAVLLVLHAELVHSGVQPHRPDQRMHVGWRCPPNHQFAIQPHVEAVVARAVQFDVARFARVPVAGPARAEESPGQVGVVVQEVEGDRGADVVEERCAVEADIGEYLPADAGPVRRAGAEKKQERGEPGGHADGAPSQAAKPTKSYRHGSLDCVPYQPRPHP